MLPACSSVAYIQSKNLKIKGFLPQMQLRKFASTGVSV